MVEWLAGWKDAVPAIGVFIASISVLVAFAAFNHTRNAARRRATLDMVMRTLMDSDVQAEYRKFRDLVRKNEDPNDAFKLTQVVGDNAIGNDDRNTVLQQLNIYELMALGIRNKLFDEKIYKRWYHNQFMADFEGVKELIDDLQRNKSSIYCEASALYRSWLRDGHPVSSASRFKMAYWAFTRQHEKIDKARDMSKSRWPAANNPPNNNPVGQ